MGDVVRRAIIPQSAAHMCSLAKCLNHGVPMRPNKMVTHSWRNLFRDLLAAVVADALDESEYSAIADLLVHDTDELEKMVCLCGNFHRTYWICAFAVSQHDGICNNTFGEVDTVSSQPYPVCI